MRGSGCQESVGACQTVNLDLQLGAAFDPHLLIGIESIDNEHGELFDLLRRLRSMPTKPANSSEFSELLGRLGRALMAHFGTEEKFLNSCAMPAAQVQRHLEAHTQILQQYVELNLDLMKHQPLAHADILQMVEYWLTDHIKLHDLQIRNYLPKPL